MSEPPHLDASYDDALMELALSEAAAALSEREVPVGCVFAAPASCGAPAGAPPFAVLAAAHNRTNASFDPTRHAEMVALDALGAGLPLPALRAALAGATLCVTVEPCVMCAAALLRAGVRRVVFGCPNDKFGGCGTVIDVMRGGGDGGGGGGAPLVAGGVRAAEAVALLKAFYARPNARTSALATV
jgi:tRNA-specific adenosine deaminase 2